jgi:hypothetical protein
MADDNGPPMIIVMVVLTAVSLIFMTLRFYCKLALSDSSNAGIDDIVLVFSFVCFRCPWLSCRVRLVLTWIRRPGSLLGLRRLLHLLHHARSGQATSGCHQATRAHGYPAHLAVLRRRFRGRVQVVFHHHAAPPCRAAMAEGGAVVHVGDHQLVHGLHLNCVVLPVRGAAGPWLRPRPCCHRPRRVRGGILGRHGLGAHGLPLPRYLEFSDEKARKDWCACVHESWCGVSVYECCRHILNLELHRGFILQLTQ